MVSGMRQCIITETKVNGHTSYRTIAKKEKQRNVQKNEKIRWEKKKKKQNWQNAEKEKMKGKTSKGQKKVQWKK